MALSISENFESYTDGNSISGGSGGSGWSANWTADANFKCTTGQTPPEGSQGAGDTDASATASRTFSAEAAGKLYFSTRVSSTSCQGAGMYLGASKLILQFRNDATIKYFNGSIYATLMSYSADTWYRCGIEWDNAGHPNQWRCMAVTQGSAEGTWTSWVSGNGTWSNLSVLGIGNPNAAAVHAYYDAISTSFDIGGGGGPTATPTLMLMGIGT